MYQERIKIDWLTVGIWLLLVVFGWLNIYSSTYNADHAALFDLHTFHGKQLLWIGASVLVAALILISEPRLYSNGAIPIYLGAIGLLVLTLFFAITVNGGKSWIDINGFRFQPTEIAKFATALALAKYMSAIDVEWHQFRTKLIALGIILLPAIVVFLQHDTGSALVFVAFALPLFREGLSGSVLIFGVAAIALFVLTLLVNKYILIAIVVALAAFYLFVWLNKRSRRDWTRTLAVVAVSTAFIFSVNFLYNKLEDHQRERIDVLLGKLDDPKSAGYNIHQSKIAIGSGGIVGHGFLQGTLTKSNFVPEQHTDFILCTVGEEWGWVGCSILIGVFIFLLVHLVNMAERQRSAFSRIYGYSVASILFVHVLINIGMVIGLLPVIGIPLPFISYGGSSLLSFTILLFIFIRLDASKNQLY